jgi:hypothetical protein
MIDGGVQIVIWKRRMYVLVDSKMFLISRQSLKRQFVSAFQGISELDFVTEVGTASVQ